MNHSRRRLLAVALAGGVTALSGCTDGDVVGGIRGGSGSDSSSEAEHGDGDDEALGDPPAPDPPTTADPLFLEYDHDRLLEASISGGVGQDGIPSIDRPRFRPVADDPLGDGAPVFGVVRDGVARAYPQYVLVWHEIVNDVIAGEQVAVTYCPLTGTAQGFERGAAEFGVSGHLVNSNLIMYDRETESWWPQLLATAIDGPMRGRSLREFRVVWTTLGEWRAAYPDSEVLTDDTGFARRYGSDPYGAYDPLQGYYAGDSTMFSPLSRPDDGHAKSVVIGARTATGAIAFDKETLLENRTLSGTIPASGAGANGGGGSNGADRLVAVTDPVLSTGYVYRDPDGLSIEADGDAYRVEGEGGGVPAAELPLESVLAFDAMWFAWAGFYPTTAFVGRHTGPGDGR
ncbi:DUF3179 domain-containing protein [Halorubrum sp. JWXQ-INN 858]|uniref:DUF3179 domain-containing protein n=1 Tax=Halorubrum sp. JWXQ-INN 858 TaxID=2690782 RepID=UPI0013580DA8|nr:DUF3179 domain-containing protein [Halorubrum sp. JWXQ-INN 858]MWV64354.1 DUF3179 domain-containing protein [Halorubrum sp. JWXQ-INN 858]